VFHKGKIDRLYKSPQGNELNPDYSPPHPLILVSG